MRPVDEERKPFLLVGSALTSLFVVGVAALVVSLAISIRPTADERPSPAQAVIVPSVQAPPPDPAPARQEAAQVPAPPPSAETIKPPIPVVQEAPQQQAPRTVYVEQAPAPAPAAPPPAPAAPAPAPAPAAPPVVAPVVVPPPVILLPRPQWTPPKPAWTWPTRTAEPDKPDKPRTVAATVAERRRQAGTAYQDGAADPSPASGRRGAPAAPVAGQRSRRGSWRGSW